MTHKLADCMSKTDAVDWILFFLFFVFFLVYIINMTQLLVKIKDSVSTFTYEYHEPVSVLVQKIADANNVPANSVTLTDLNGKVIDHNAPLVLNSRPNMILASF